MAALGSMAPRPPASPNADSRPTGTPTPPVERRPAWRPSAAWRPRPPAGPNADSRPTGTPTAPVKRPANARTAAMSSTGRRTDQGSAHSSAITALRSSVTCAARMGVVPAAGAGSVQGGTGRPAPA